MAFILIGQSVNSGGVGLADAGKTEGSVLIGFSLRIAGLRRRTSWTPYPARGVGAATMVITSPSPKDLCGGTAIGVCFCSG
jgi:hypothetical protein